MFQSTVPVTEEESLREAGCLGSYVTMFCALSSPSVGPVFSRHNFSQRISKFSVSKAKLTKSIGTWLIYLCCLLEVLGDVRMRKRDR